MIYTGTGSTTTDTPLITAEVTASIDLSPHVRYDMLPTIRYVLSSDRVLETIRTDAAATAAAEGKDRVVHQLDSTNPSFLVCQSIAIAFVIRHSLSLTHVAGGVCLFVSLGSR